MSCNTKKLYNVQLASASPETVVTIPAQEQGIIKHMSVTDVNADMATDKNGNCVDIIINDSDGIGDAIYAQAVEVPWGSSVTPLMGFLYLESGDMLKVQPHRDTELDISVHYILEEAPV
jgi:hypothetical protein